MPRAAAALEKDKLWWAIYPSQNDARPSEDPRKPEGLRANVRNAVCGHVKSVEPGLDSDSEAS
jgi:hypothetical protein